MGQEQGLGALTGSRASMEPASGLHPTGFDPPERIEYRTLDKSEWVRGPWDDEPDKVQYRDEATGFPCLIVRGPVGALCGYIGVPPGHPWHGVDYNSVMVGEDEYPDVHWGLTYAGGCQHGDDPSKGICHIPAHGEPDNVWWLGFDCAHSGDLTEIKRSYGPEFREYFEDVYRDVPFVEAQCRKLARQAAIAIEAAAAGETPQDGSTEGESAGRRHRQEPSQKDSPDV